MVTIDDVINEMRDNLLEASRAPEYYDYSFDKLRAYLSEQDKKIQDLENRFDKLLGEVIDWAPK